MFRTYGPAEGLANGFVRTIYEDRKNTLWVGTDRGLFRLEKKSLVRVDGRGGIPKINVHAICEDREGRLLVGGSGILVMGSGSWTYYRSKENLADNSVRAIRQDSAGALWIGTISGLRRLDRGLDGDPFASPRIIDGVNISFLDETERGVFWVGTYGQGLLRFVGEQMVRFGAPSALPHNNVLAVAGDSENNVWVGTLGGLLRLSPSVATTVTTSEKTPLSINTIYEDPRGGLFAAALDGRLFTVSKSTLVPFDLPAAVAGLPIRNVFRDGKGALWIGTDGRGVVRLSGGQTVRYTMKSGLVNDFIRAFAEDRDGSLWIGTDGGLSCWRNGAFQNFDAESGLAYGSIRVLVIDRKGDLWVGTDGGLSRVRSGSFLADPLLDRLRGRKIWSICEDRDGGMWIGTKGSGLFLLKGGKLFQFTTGDGLPSPKIYSILENKRGDLWVSGPSGIISVSRRDLERRAADPSTPVAVRVYSTSDGLSANQMSGGVQPAGVLTSAGELWLPSTRGAVRLKPDNSDLNGAPPVLIEETLADDRNVPFVNGVRLPPGGGKLEIHYTAIRLRSPERLRFRYWMEGLDQDWTEAGSRRVAYYTNMPAGTYRFHVAAYEAMDPHNPTEQVLEVQWSPHFYQTAWFMVLCGAAAVVMAWLSYQLHVRGVHRRYAAVLDERNRLAREMHDTLIQGCIGVSALLEAASSAREVSPEVSHGLLDRARNEVRATVDEARLAVWNLRQGSASPQELVAAISQLTQRVSRETGIPVTFKGPGAPLPLQVRGGPSLLMLVREALYNAVRHAAPRNLSVAMDFDLSGLEVEIRDDGRGFDPSAKPSPNGYHYGLIGMRERVDKLGGELHISSSPGAGARVRFRIPVRRLNSGA